MPEEIQLDVIRNMGEAGGYTDSKGLFAPRKAIMHQTQSKHISGVTVDDIIIGNGVSELIVMAMQALVIMATKYWCQCQITPCGQLQ